MAWSGLVCGGWNYLCWFGVLRDRCMTLLAVGRGRDIACKREVMREQSTTIGNHYKVLLNK